MAFIAGIAAFAFAVSYVLFEDPQIRKITGILMGIASVLLLGAVHRRASSGWTARRPRRCCWASTAGTTVQVGNRRRRRSAGLVRSAGSSRWSARPCRSASGACGRRRGLDPRSRRGRRCTARLCRVQELDTHLVGAARPRGPRRAAHRRRPRRRGDRAHPRHARVRLRPRAGAGAGVGAARRVRCRRPPRHRAPGAEGPARAGAPRVPPRARRRGVGMDVCSPGRGRLGARERLDARRDQLHRHERDRSRPRRGSSPPACT